MKKLKKIIVLAASREAIIGISILRKQNIQPLSSGA